MPIKQKQPLQASLHATHFRILVLEAGPAHALFSQMMELQSPTQFPNSLVNAYPLCGCCLFFCITYNKREASDNN